MLLEKNHTVIGLAVVAVIAAGTLLALGATAGMFVRGDTYEAEFADAAGLKSGDFVYVAGHRAGEVLAVDIDGEIARVRFSSTAPELPADSMAEVILSNTLGKRGLALTPGTSSAVLEDGDVIPLSRTVTPIDLPEIGDRTTELLTGVDVEAMRELTTSLADVTEGNRDDVERLLRGVEDVTRIVSERREELQTVLDRANTLVDAAADKDRELVAIIDDFGAVLDRLVQRRADVSRLLATTASQSQATAALIGDNREQLDRVLASFHQDLELIDAHQVDFAHSLAYLGVSFYGFSSIGVSGGDARVDNPSWGNVFVTGLGSVGVGALLECSGALDVALTNLLGPDPRCEDVENPGQSPEPGPPAEDGDDRPAGPLDPPTLPDLGEATDELTNRDALERFLGGRGGGEA
ncbi:MAG: MCE family protein [Actinobacteria bacterium]|jgi:phospholipid/cholesterol/gamma-HCH transport system substrate-binding protein|nr:MCE family protein [Actinomycetota bacterium]